MSKNNSRSRQLALIGAGLAGALLIAVVLSPWSSKNPDGLDRVSQDLKFENKAAEKTLAKELPFASIFDEYALKGVPENLAAPIAGFIGTLATFALAWGIGKLVIRNSSSSDR